LIIWKWLTYLVHAVKYSASGIGPYL